MPKLLFAALVLIASFQTHAQSVKKIYVTAATAKLKVEAKAGAADVVVLTRGKELEVVSEQGPWYQVKSDAQAGWVSKLFVSTQKPIGQNEMLKESAVTDEKMSRKRASGYAVSAATRGLAASSRTRGEQFRSNHQALEQLEKNQVKPEEIEKFDAEAQLGQGK